jgi:hypothetical protein
MVPSWRISLANNAPVGGGNFRLHTYGEILPGASKCAVQHTKNPTVEYRFTVPGMGMFRLLTEGGWLVHSESDPRWRASGVCDVGMFAMPADCQAAIAALEAKYGDPPLDLEWSYCKY